MSFLDRGKRVLVDKILGVSDTPHRIAWGVALGFLIAWTPTLGLQIVLYLALASLLGANKVSGMPILFVMNPATMLPVCFLNWRLGSLVMHGELSAATSTAADAAAGFGGSMLDLSFWQAAGNKLLSMGVEIWVGALVLGLVTGIPSYFLTHRAVRTYRDRSDEGSLAAASVD